MTVWQEIESGLNQPASTLKNWYKQAGTGVYTSAKISQLTGMLEPHLDFALTMMVDAGLLQLQTQEYCFHCKQLVNEESKSNNTCVHCGDDQDLEVENLPVYVVIKAKTRDINWMLVVHGMNTVGTWQQEFSWLLANHYKHAVPVYIYKYGNIKIKPLLLLSQKKQIKQLATAIRAIQKQAPEGKPDVVAHSYGTFLLSEIIKDPSYQDIKLGRIILVGSIIRPDYDWQSIIQSKRVEQVMCHHSKKDHIVPLAHYTIPGSGPSGKIGFNDTIHVHHHQEKDYGHSSYFEAENLNSIFPNVWKKFLTAANPIPAIRSGQKKWQPSMMRFISHPLKLLILLGLLAALALLLVSAYLGLPDALGLIEQL